MNFKKIMQIEDLQVRAVLLNKWWNEQGKIERKTESLKALKALKKFASSKNVNAYDKMVIKLLDDINANDSELQNLLNDLIRYGLNNLEVEQLTLDTCRNIYTKYYDEIECIGYTYPKIAIHSKATDRMVVTTTKLILESRIIYLCDKVANMRPRYYTSPQY